ncbi:MAG TPA: amidohydrolase family protein [Xanthobacteraceae bacterium]|nr:amidohydrolase family protein [Xanthobacteraceae bacterium]
MERNRRAPEWVRETRAPVPLPPPMSCDCQFHIFGDAAKYPLRYDVTFAPPAATFTDMRGVLRKLGFGRGVIVHTQRYDTDHSLLIDEPMALPPDERKNFRAIGIVRDNRDSAMETGWDDAIPFAKAFIAVAPDRMIWGTDWPHTGWRKQRMMNDAEVVELLYRYVDHDPELTRKILVTNPARLHGFAG